MKIRHIGLIGTALAAIFLSAWLSADQKNEQAELALKAAIKTETVDGNLKGAIEQYKAIAALSGASRATVANALLRMGQCYEKLGQVEARAAYERVVREFGDQAEAAKVAQARLSALRSGGGALAARTDVATRRVYVGEPDEEYVSLSPDGRYIVLNRPEVGGYWLRDLQSGRRFRLPTASSGAAQSGALVSPDGKRIVHLWERRGGTLEIRVSSLDGSSDQVLYQGTDKGILMLPIAWMPDGRRILAGSFDIRAKTYQINQRHIISLQDGAVRDVGQPEKGGDMHWGDPSPDGRYAAYAFKNDIFLYDTTTEQDSALVQNPAYDHALGWTPDGSGLVFESDRSGTRDLYLQEIEKGRPRGEPRMVKREVGSGRLILTRDGRLFRFENTGGEDSFTASVDELSGKLTSSPVPVDGDSFPTILWPGWSADGKQLYYAVFKKPALWTPVLSIRSPETGPKREILPNPKLNYSAAPVLSPDGRRFAVGGMGPDKDFGVFAIASENGDVTQLAKVTPAGINPCPNWSPDGRAIFYKMTSPEKGTEFLIKRKDLSSGEETEVFRGFHTREMKISPEGRRFAYVRTDKPGNSDVLGVLDLQSRKELELWRVPLPDSAAIGTTTGMETHLLKAPAWTPDGRHVLAGRDLKPGTELWRFPAAGGPGEKLHVFAETTSGFVLHPSRTRLAFTQRRPSFELWELENFLPPADKIVK